MPANIRPRKSIREHETHQREESHQEDGIILENYDISSSRSESDEEYEDTFKITKHKFTQVKISRKASRPPQQNKQKTTTSIISNKPPSEISLLWWFVPFLILFVIGACYYHHKESLLSLMKSKESCSFGDFQKKYPNETDLMWKYLEVGIEMILNKKIDKPAVYLLAHHGRPNSNRLIEKIAQHSSKCIGKKLVPMKSHDFILDQSSDDYGYAIEKYKSKIKEGNVFLIANLNEIPAKAARAFHTICDTHSPIQKNVVIFLALTIKENKEGNPHSVAEETLVELWGSELGKHELDPLITRVTDQVFILKS